MMPLPPPNRFLSFSVLMSLYDREQAAFLQQCFESLQTQSLPANEIVLVLDGVSNPALLDCVQIWSKRLPLKVITLAQNMGLGRALNEGLKHCQHDWVFRMDTDDICCPDRFAKQMAYLQAHPDVVLLGGAIQEFDEQRPEFTAIRSVPIEQDAIRQRANTRNPFNHATVAYRKSVIEQVGGYQHHLFCEDYNLWLRVLSASFAVHNLEDVLVNARVAQSTYERRRGWQYVQSEWQLMKLKISLNIQSALPALGVFSMRAMARLLPVGILKRLYVCLRQKPI